MTAVDVHPPLYYFCLKLWSLVFGTSDFALRFMSVALGAVAIILAFFLFKRWFGAKTAGILTLFLAVSPLLIRYSQEMRMYMLAFVWVISATLVLEIALKDKRRWAWIAYAVLIALGMWTHYFTALIWLVQLGYILWTFKKEGWQKMAFWAYGLAVLLYVPWIPSFIQQVLYVQSGFWIGAVSLTTPLDFLSESLIYKEATEATGWLMVLVIALTAATAILLKYKRQQLNGDERNGLLKLVLLTLVPPLLLIILSLPPLSPTYVTRYVVYSASFVWAIVGLGVIWGLEKAKNTQPKQAARMKKVAIIAVLLAVVVATVGIIQVDTRDNTGEAKTLMTALQPELATGEPILAHLNSMGYYEIFFYETPANHIYAVDMDVAWPSYEPIRTYDENYLFGEAEVDEVISQNASFWYVVDAGETAPSYGDFTIADKVETDSYTAYHYQLVE